MEEGLPSIPHHQALRTEVSSGVVPAQRPPANPEPESSQGERSRFLSRGVL